MPSILHDLVISSPPGRVFKAITEPAQIDNWWTLRSSGAPVLGNEYRLYFGEPYDWRAVVSDLQQDRIFEWHMTHALEDWIGTKVRFVLIEIEGGTNVSFSHSGWKDHSEHYRISSYCWAQLLRLLKRWVEAGEVLEHPKRALL
jgi:uncharacterized protein YndB with AHSA1/START domain